MKRVEASGSYREIGRCTGEALRDEIAANLEQRSVEADLRDACKAGRLATYRARLAEGLPELWEEIEGTAEGSGQPVEAIAALNTPLGYSRELDDNCTNVAFSSGPDGPVFGKNNDGSFPETERQCPVACRRIIPAKGIPLVTFTFAGWVGFADGMNAEGLAMGHSSVGSVFQQSDAHTQVRLWAHWGMLNCKTTAEFAAHMASQPTRGKGYAWVAADRAGDAVSLEIPCPITQVRRSTHPQGHVHCVNLYQLPQLHEADRRQPDMKRLAVKRWQMLDDKLDEDGPFDLERMQSLLRFHGEPGMCRHGGFDVSHTEWSYIGLPASGRVLYYHGNPCEGEYSEVLV